MVLLSGSSEHGRPKQYVKKTCKLQKLSGGHLPDFLKSDLIERRHGQYLEYDAFSLGALILIKQESDCFRGFGFQKLQQNDFASLEELLQHFLLLKSVTMKHNK